VWGVRPDLIVFSASIQEQDSNEIPTATPMFSGSNFPIMLFPKLSDLIDAVIPVVDRFAALKSFFFAQTLAVGWEESECALLVT